MRSGIHDDEGMDCCAFLALRCACRIIDIQIQALTCAVNSGTDNDLYCWLPREVRGAKPIIKKWSLGNGIILTASYGGGGGSTGVDEMILVAEDDTTIYAANAASEGHQYIQCAISYLAEITVQLSREAKRACCTTYGS